MDQWEEDAAWDLVDREDQWDRVDQEDQEAWEEVVASEGPAAWDHHRGGT